MKYSICFIIIVIFFVSCSDINSPEGVLKEFVNYRFQENQSRNVLLEMTYGKIREMLRDMTNDEFEKFVEINSLKKNKLKLVIKNCKENICFITYILNYSKHKDNIKDFMVEVKKIAKLEYIDEKWLISDVSNVKTYIESIVPIDVLATP